MVIHEKCLEFFTEALAQIINVLDARTTVIGNLHREDPIIPLFLFAVTLFAFNDADHPTFEFATDKRRLIHQHQNIEWVAVAAKGGGGTKPKSYGNAMPAGKTVLSSKICSPAS
jgi:hypothetical protein